MWKRDEIEQKILRGVALSLWMMILLVLTIAYLLKDSVIGGFREAIVLATSIMTQIYVIEPSYGFIIFLLAFVGKVLVIYIVYILILLFNEGLFRQSLEEGRIMRNIKNLKNHYIICGGGRVGSNVAQDLSKAKKKFVILDKDAEIIEFFKKKKMLAILGDSFDSEFLKQAGIDKAKVLVSCLNHDGDNILQIIVSKKMNKSLKIVSRASHEKFVANLKNAGANEIIVPEVIGGKEIAQAALKFK